VTGQKYGVSGSSGYLLLNGGKRTRKTVAFMNNHYAGHAPAGIKLNFCFSWPVLTSRIHPTPYRAALSK
jgi:hypothetical protein